MVRAGLNVSPSLFINYLLCGHLCHNWILGEVFYINEWAMFYCVLLYYSSFMLIQLQKHGKSPDGYEE